MSQQQQPECLGRLMVLVVGLGGIPAAAWLLAFAAGLALEYGGINDAQLVDAAAPPSGPAFVRIMGLPQGTFPSAHGTSTPVVHATWIKEERTESMQDVKERRANGTHQYVRKNVVSYRTVDTSTEGVNDFALGSVRIRVVTPSPRWMAAPEVVRQYTETGAFTSEGLRRNPDHTYRERSSLVRADRPVIVLGWLEGGLVTGREGSPFIVAGIPETELVAKLGTEGSVRIWVIRGLAFLLFWAGLAWVHGLVNASNALPARLLFAVAFATWAGALVTFKMSTSLGTATLGAATVTSLAARLLIRGTAQP